MKNKIWLTVNLVFLLIVGFFAFGERGNAQKTDAWEYRTEKIEFSETSSPASDLNWYGQYGWELVTIERFPNQRYSMVVFKKKK